MIKKYTTNFKCDSHSYTRSPEPWCVDVEEETYNSVSPAGRKRWKLFHYLSGGGFRMFGRTLEQDIRSRRQTRFLILAAGMFLVWFVLWIA